MQSFEEKHTLISETCNELATAFTDVQLQGYRSLVLRSSTIDRCLCEAVGILKTLPEGTTPVALSRKAFLLAHMYFLYKGLGDDAYQLQELIIGGIACEILNGLNGVISRRSFTTGLGSEYFSSSIEGRLITQRAKAPRYKEDSVVIHGCTYKLRTMFKWSARTFFVDEFEAFSYSRGMSDTNETAIQTTDLRIGAMPLELLGPNSTRDALISVEKHGIVICPAEVNISEWAFHFGSKVTELF